MSKSALMFLLHVWVYVSATYEASTSDQACAASEHEVEEQEYRETETSKLELLQGKKKKLKDEESYDEIDYSELSQIWTRASLKAKLQLASDIIHIIPSMVATTRLNLWEAIPVNDGATFDEIVSRTKTSPKGMDTLLQVMLALGAVTWGTDTERIYNVFSKYYPQSDPYTKAFTVETLGDSVAMQRQLYYLADSVREGRAVGLTKVYGDYESLYEARVDIPELAQDWDPWMDMHNGDTVAQLSFMYQLPSVVARIGTDSKEFKGHVLDWCGNDGKNAIRLAQNDPTMKLTVLDLPEQVAKAEGHIKAAGLQGQIDTMGADLYDDDLAFAQKYDAVLMIHMQREWPWVDLTRFAKIIHSILKPGGVIVVFPMSDHHRESIGNFTNFQPDPTRASKINVYFLNSASHTQCPKTGNEMLSMLTDVGFVDATYSSMSSIVGASKP